MKHIHSALIACAFFCALAGSTLAQQRDTVVILHINDTHANLLPSGPRAADMSQTMGGIARAVSYVGAQKMADPQTLFMHAGDMSIGDLFFNGYFSLIELELLSEANLDVMSLGNHEFDLGSGILMSILDTAQVPFPILCANMTVLDASVARLATHVLPHTTLLSKGHKIGVFGLVTPEANFISNPLPEVYLESDTALARIILAEVQALKADGCEAVILLSHLGRNGDRLVAETFPGIDLIIGAHDHYAETAPLYVTNTATNARVPIVQAGAFYQNIGRASLVFSGKALSGFDWQLVPLDQRVPEEPTTRTIVDFLATELETTFGYPLFTSTATTVTETLEELPSDPTKTGFHDTPVANLITDAFRDFTKTDIAITACGATAQPLYKGPVTPNDVFRMIGYGFNPVTYVGFRVVSFDISGAAMLVGLEFGLSQIELSDEFLVQTSGMEYEYNPAAPPYQRLLPGKVLVGGQPLDPTKRYTVTTNEFVLAIFNAIVQQSGIDTLGNIQGYNDFTELQVVLTYLAKNSTYSPVRRRGPLPVQRLESGVQSLALGHYPNPVSSSTEIIFDIPEAAQTTLTVYDAAGRTVGIVVDARLEAGRHTRHFDASALAPGMYSYVLRSGAVVKTQRLVKIK